MTVEERLQLIEDERSILQTLYAYGHGIDYGLEEEFLDCWLEDADLFYSSEIANREVDTGRPNSRHFVGREQIAGFFRKHTHAPDAYHKHFLVEPRVRVDGDSATVTSYFTRLDHSPQGPKMSSFGRYEDVLERCPDGRWRFRARRGSIESRVPR